MKHEVNKLPATLAALPSISQRLHMSERSILSRLPNGQSASSSSHSHDYAYGNYANYIGPFALPAANGVTTKKSSKAKRGPTDGSKTNFTSLLDSSSSSSTTMDLSSKNKS